MTTTVSTDVRYRCDEHAGFNEALTACSVHPVYEDDVIVGAYHATAGVEDGRVIFEDDDAAYRQEAIAEMAEFIHMQEGAA